MFLAEGDLPSAFSICKKDTERKNGMCKAWNQKVYME